MSGWRAALQLLAFKEHPPGPPVTVLLNKHGAAHRHQWPQMKSPLREGTPFRSLVVHLRRGSGRYLDRKGEADVLTFTKRPRVPVMRSA